MNDETSLQVIPDNQPSELSPAEIIAHHSEQAEALMQVVEDRKVYATIGGKKYLQAEAWEIIGAFNHIRAETEWVRPEPHPETEGQIVGYEAKVRLVDIVTGDTRGSGIMSCGFDEFPCRGKEASARNKAAKSAAQTWAMSKAYRQNYSWVAVLAGFDPTPAGEMADGVAQPSMPQRATKQPGKPSGAVPQAALNAAAAPPKPKAEVAVVEDEGATAFDHPPEELRTVGDLLTMAYRTHGKSLSDVLQVLNVPVQGSIQPPFDERWKEMEAAWGQKS
jgi:hypothetical protein